MKLQKICASLLAFVLLCGCSGQVAPKQDETDVELDFDQVYIDAVPLVEIWDEGVALADDPTPALPTVLKPVAAGSKVAQNSKATIDYSNTKDGYVMVKCSSTKKLKVRVFGPSYEKNGTVYTYDLPSNTWTTFPLSDGNGGYKVVVYENVSGTSYATALSTNFNVTLTDEFAPFLRPNQYVNYENATKSLAKAAELTEGVEDPLKMVEKIYDYVVKNLTYDKEKAKTVQSGYLPVLDDTLSSGKGICFDYAALMTGMLRSQGVPCKLVIGYAGTQYHAWVSVWTEETGWVEGAVYFDGVSWQRMDPTFISSGKNSEAARQYVGDGKNYNAMYLY